MAVSDKVNTAIDRLCTGVAPYHENLDYSVIDVHPKRPSEEQLKAFAELAFDADILDWQYFRTAEMLRSRFDWLKGKKHILTHNNPYSITESDWNSYDLVIGNNKSIYKDLQKITQSRLEYIPLTVESDFWTFKREFTPKDQVLMVANRIEGKKGILEVAIACADLQVKLVLVGAISDQNYFQAIMATGNVDFRPEISNEELRELYWESLIHVCNSQDNFESGTLPILEAMFCGTPILTRKVGHVPDLYNNENMLINEHSYEDVVKLTEVLHDAISDKKNLEKIREKAWNSVKGRNFERRAFAYQKAYRSVMHDTEPVSVIVPIVDFDTHTQETLNAVANQTYKNIELIVVDDSTEPEYTPKPLVEFARYVDFPVRYIATAEFKGGEYGDDKDYGLARARNEGAIYATGDVLVFVDQRIKMNPEAVQVFMSEIQPKNWLYGDKGVKKDFVENFSCIRKDDFVNFGMFSERMDCYGGLSQETRMRGRNQGLHIRHVEHAKAVAQGKSKNKFTKKQEIIRSKNRLHMMGLE